MKTFHIFVFSFSLLLSFNTFAQYRAGTALQLFSDPAQYSAGKPNIGAGAYFGVYDRYRPDFGLRLSGAGWTQSGIGQADLQSMRLNAGLQVYPFGIRDQLFLYRRSFSQRARFHHQLKVKDRVKTCGSSCYDPRGPGLTKLLRGFHAGIGYEYTATEGFQASAPPGMKIIRHGLNLELGYAVSFEFLWLGITWRPLGVYSPELTKVDKGYQPPRGPKEAGGNYEPAVALHLGLALFN